MRTTHKIIIKTKDIETLKDHIKNIFEREWVSSHLVGNFSYTKLAFSVLDSNTLYATVFVTEDRTLFEAEMFTTLLAQNGYNAVLLPLGVRYSGKES